MSHGERAKRKANAQAHDNRKSVKGNFTRAMKKQSTRRERRRANKEPAGE